MKTLLTYLIALVWLINGLYCKILNQMPRHTEIVERILGLNYAREITIIIGFSELLMVVWIISKIYTKYCAIAQICIILIMNILEFIMVPDLLLWGKMNLIFASIFCLFIYYNEFIFNKKSLKC